MLPDERQLVERLADEPFALVGVNSDGDRETVKGILEDNEISWRNAIDGGTDGPWATQWNVRSWPTIYILDGEGVIRYRDLRDEAMENAALALLGELADEPGEE